MGSRASVAPRPARQVYAHNKIGTPAVRLAASLTIAFLILFNVALISLEVGSIPIRGFLAIAILGVLSLVMPGLLMRSLARHVWVLALAGALALLGIFVSVVNGVSPAIIGRMLLEVHVQTLVTLLLATMLAELAGPRAAVAAICAALGVSALVAIIQSTGLDPAWDLRKALGDLQGHKLMEDSSFINRRPMGVSYSPIHLSTQACLGFAAFAALRLWSVKDIAQAKNIDWLIMAGIAALVIVSFVSLTRSPILGAAVFVGLYLLWRGSAFYSLLIIAAGICATLAAPMIIEMMQASDNRVFRIGDNSSSGRFTLVTYGMMLLADNPLGYGFGFVSQDYWGQYWQDIYTMPSAGEVREAELHNYALNMMTTYGIGLLLVVPLIARLLWSGRFYLIAFVPYVVHLIFHNTGPFWNDTLFWFVIGAISVMSGREEQPMRSPRPMRKPRPPRISGARVA